MLTNQGVAIKVEVPGRTDYIISSLDPTVRIEFQGGIAFQGRYGVISFEGDKFAGARLVSTSYVKVGDVVLTYPEAEYKGTVTAFDKGMAAKNNKIYVDTPLPTDGSLVGLQIHIKNDGERDASYPIESLERVGDKTAISVGSYTFVEGFKDKSNPFGSLTYNFKEGDEFYIPLPRCVSPEEVKMK